MSEMQTRTVDGVHRAATLSWEGTYRWTLTRRWGDGPLLLPWIMLNPSTADATSDDPTILRCMGFARREGYDGIRVVNLYAYRATDPKDLWLAGDPTGGAANNFELMRVLRGPVAPVAAWGANARPDRVAWLMGLPFADRLRCLGTTKAGAPRHPLYVKADTPFVPYEPAERRERPVVDAVAEGMRDADIAEQIAREPRGIASADTPRGHAARALDFIAEHLTDDTETGARLRGTLGLHRQLRNEPTLCETCGHDRRDHFRGGNCMLVVCHETRGDDRCHAWVGTIRPQVRIVSEWSNQ